MKCHNVHQDHERVGCIPRGKQKEAITKVLDCWVENMEEQCGLRPAQRASKQCYPGYNCMNPSHKRQPNCSTDPPPGFSPLITNIQVSERRYVSDNRVGMEEQDPRVKFVVVGQTKKSELPPAPSERPRVKSVMLIGGEFRKVNDCFKRNGINDFDFCPKTESGELMTSLMQMVNEDRRLHGDPLAKPVYDCCCQDFPSRLKQFKCLNCPPPKPPMKSAHDPFHHSSANHSGEPKCDCQRPSSHHNSVRKSVNFHNLNHGNGHHHQQRQSSEDEIWKRFPPAYGNFLMEKFGAPEGCPMPD